MSIPLKLSIHDGSTTYTYENDRITTEEPSIETRADDRTLQLSDVKVVIGGGSLLGISNFRSLPTGQLFRAELRRTDTSTVLLDGAVRSDDIDYDARTDTFGVRIFDQAQQEVWTALSDFYLDELGLLYYRNNGSPAPELDTRTTKTVYADPPDAPDTWFPNKDIDWYRTMSTAEMAFKQLGRLGEITVGTLTLPGNLYDFKVEYTDSNGDDQETIVSFSPYLLGSGFGLMPAVPADTWIENLLDWGGYWLSVQYDSFPGTQVNIEWVDSKWDPQSTDPTTDLSGVETPDRYGERVERREYALEYSGEIGDQSELVTTEGFEVPVADTDYSPSPPPSYGVYADRNWSLESPKYVSSLSGVRQEGNRTSRLQDVLTLDLRPAHVHVEGRETSGFKDVVYGQPFTPNNLATMSNFDTWQKSLDNVNDTGDPFRARSRSDVDPNVRCIDAVKGNDTPYAAHHKEVDPAGDQFKVYQLTWARQPWQNQHLKREDEYLIEGKFILDGQDFPILSVEEGVTFDGGRWYGRRKERSLTSLNADVRLRQPISTQERAGLPETVNDLTSWRPTELSFDVVQDVNGDKMVVCSWFPPPAYKGRPLYYDVDIEVTEAGTTTVDASKRLDRIYYTTERLDVSSLSGDHDVDVTVFVYTVDGDKSDSLSASKRVNL